MVHTSGILGRNIHETPIAVIDFETTGLTPGLDRVVEASVVRFDPSGDIQVVLDTLVNPRGPVGATEIHGISDADVADAPTFEEIAGDLVEAIADCPVAAYNVYFDIKFLMAELQQVGLDIDIPHFCLMYMRPMLGLGSRCRLENACEQHGVHYSASHIASADAIAAAQLMDIYLNEMRSMKVQTFAELGKLKRYKFVSSFGSAPLSISHAEPLNRGGVLKSRGGYDGGIPSVPTGGDPVAMETYRNPIAVYWDALRMVLGDLQITDDEITELQNLKEELGLVEEQIRAMHTRAFIGVLSRFVDDFYLDEKECQTVGRLHRCLSLLGWAPGEV